MDKRASLKPFLEPESVAIVGAVPTPGRGGYLLVKNLLDWGFSGKIYPVHPRAELILGLKTYSRVSLIPEPIDLAIIFIPAPQVLEVMKDCARKSVKQAMIISAGFSEEGNVELEQQILKVAGTAGVRILGPNTNGVINTSNNFLTPFIPMEAVPRGKVSFITQTGQLLGGIAEHISSSSFGLSKAIDLGNKADITEIEALDYLSEDPETQVIGMYLEGVKDGRAFIECARKVTKRQPVILLKGGITDAGSRMVRSHTGSIAGRKEIFDAACKQAGIVLVETFEELLATIEAFSLQPLPRGNRVAIVSPTGAECVVTSDLCSQSGLEIAQLSDETIKGISDITPFWRHISNPVDILAAAEKIGRLKAWTMVLEALIKDENVDGVIASVPVCRGVGEFLLDLQIKSDKPVLFSFRGYEGLIDIVSRQLGSRGFPAYRSSYTAVKSLSNMWRYAKLRAQAL